MSRELKRFLLMECEVTYFKGPLFNVRVDLQGPPGQNKSTCVTVIRALPSFGHCRSEIPSVLGYPKLFTILLKSQQCFDERLSP